MVTPTSIRACLAVAMCMVCYAPAAVPKAQSAAWHAIGPAPPAVITPVVVGSAGSGVVYIGSFGGGVLKSGDEGRTFESANQGLTNLAVAAIAAHPANIDHVYVDTFGAGSFQTVDGGRHWTALPMTQSLTLTIAIDSRQPAVIYKGLLGGPRLLKSLDGGVTWRNANAGLPIAPVWTIRIDPASSNVVYAGTGGGGGFRSVDGGESWTQVSLSPNVLALVFDPRDSRILYAGTDGHGVYRSFDGGNTFLAAGVPGDGHVLSLAHDPSRRGVVYAGTTRGGVWVSFDFAETFTQTAYTHGSALSLSTSATGDVYVGTNLAGVLKSGSYGTQWTSVAGDTLNALKAQSVYGLTIDPQNPDRLLVATNEGGMLESSDAGRTWRDSSTGITSHTPRTAVFDPADANRVYAGSLYGGGVFVSENGGRTWSRRKFGSPAVYVYTAAVAPDRVVYAGTLGEGLWRSIDLGSSFTRIVETPFTDVQGVAVDPSNVNHLFAAGGQGLYRSTDRGATWTRLIAAFSNNIVFDPRDPRTVYASTQTLGVQRSTDGGSTFSALNNGLAVLRTSRGAGVVIDPRDSRVLYVGTEGGGVFKSRDGGASWFPINEGLRNLTVFALAIDPRNPDTVYAGGGSSVYKTTTAGEDASSATATTREPRSAQ